MAEPDLAYPYDTIVRITDTIGGQTWQASGVLISPDEVLTASHVVYIAGEGTATNIIVSPGYDDGDSPYGSVPASSFHYIQVDDASRLLTNEQSQFDYAVIHLSQPFLTIGTMGIEANFPGGTVNISGYPSSAGGDQVTSTQTVTRDPAYTLLEGASIGNGSSGGPVWAETVGGPEVVGIVSTANALGVGFNLLITPAVLSQIQAWVAEDDGSETVTAAMQPIATVPRRFIDGGDSPDILWRNVNGQASIWTMADAARTGGGPLGVNPGPSWTDVATGDFNGDGRSDILWQNANGQASIWEMDGATRIGGGPAGPNPGPSWTVAGSGDFNGDGLSDILWRNTSTGQVSIWEMDGATRIGGGPVAPVPGPGWRTIGAGDFNHDGKADILWQNASTEQISIWEMDGNTRVGGGPVTANPGSGWTAVGTGDFNGDGRSDILFRSASGQVAIWEMDGTSVIGGGTIASNPGLGWTAVGTGDFNNDGHSDILWQNANGQASIWDMDGANRIGGGPVSPNPGPGWRAA